MTPTQQRNVEWYRGLPPFRTSLGELARLSEYSASNPTGVTINKTWRRHNGAFDHEFRRAGGRPFWVVVRYEADPDDENMARIVTYRPVITVRAGSRPYPCLECTEPMECGSWAHCFKHKRGWLT